MTSGSASRLRELLDRIARVAAAEEWSEDLNPAQRAALGYLARANRFSRAPSHVADFLCTTRGTASQTLKALHRKGLVEQGPTEGDRRSIAYRLTPTGRAALRTGSGLDDAITGLSDAETGALERSLERLLRAALRARGHREFGVCNACRHHEATATGARCALLNVALTPADAEALCHEFAPQVAAAPNDPGAAA